MSPARRPSSGRPPGRGGGRATGRGRGGPPPRGRQQAGGDEPRGPSAPRGLGGEQVEGRQAVRELLLGGRRRVRDVWLVDDVDGAPIIGDILELADELRIKVRRVTRNQLDAEARSEAPQGVLAHAAPLPEAELDSLCRRGRDGRPPFLLALDGITDPQNVGALLRTAECAGVSGVLLPKHRAAHITPTVAKAAAGAVEHLDIALVSGLPAALTRAKELGVWSVGLDGAGDTSLFDLTVATEPIVLVLGAEGSGLSRLTMERCDVVAAIPLAGALSSLNVSAAGALACFEVARRRLG
ncbi:MAG: rRNA methyltransferase [Acidimicrobiales bacterium]|nr:rRNA methyltransferase [Acidimicrobiales bacterium]